MALSLNDLKSPNLHSAKKDTKPKKTPLMPWQQRESSGAVSLQPEDPSGETAPSVEPTTKWQQTGNEPTTNQIQTDNKLATNRQHTIAPEQGNRQQTGNGTGNNRATNRQQTGNKTGNKPTTKQSQNVDLADLCGLQEKALLFLFESCRYNASRESEPILNAQVAEVLKTTPHSAKVTLQRLQAKGFVHRSGFKNGRGGWSTYEIPEGTYRALSVRETRSKLATNRQQTDNETGNKLTTKPATEPATTPLSSSSYIENKFTPTTAETRARAEDVWTPEDLDYSMLTDVGFGRSQALQLRSLGLSFDVVQRSLVYFEFELRYTASGKTIQEPLALLMKRMRQNGSWEAPEEYEKRHAHFHTRFAEREQQLQEKEPAEEKNGDFLETGGCITSPSDVDQGLPLR